MEYTVYLSRLMRYFKACDFYQDFLDRGLTTNKDVTESRAPSYYVEVFTSKTLRLSS
jgi:hypothetical protein